MKIIFVPNGYDVDEGFTIGDYVSWKVNELLRIRKEQPSSLCLSLASLEPLETPMLNRMPQEPAEGTLHQWKEQCEI